MKHERTPSEVERDAVAAAVAVLREVPGMTEEAIEAAAVEVDKAVFHLGHNAVRGSSAAESLSNVFGERARTIASAIAAAQSEMEEPVAGPHDSYCAMTLSPDEYDKETRQWQADLETTIAALHRIGEHNHRLEKAWAHPGMKRKKSDKPWLDAFYRTLFEIYSRAAAEAGLKATLSKTPGPGTHAMNFLLAVSNATFSRGGDSADAIYRHIRPRRKTGATSA